MTKVVITGYAALAATGQNIDTIWDAIKTQRSGLREIESWDASQWEYRIAGEVADYQPRKMLKDRKLLKVLSRQDVIGLAAVEQAIAQSDLIPYRDSLENQAEFNDRTGVFVASPGNKFCQQYDFVPLLAQAKDDWSAFGKNLFDDVHPMWLLRILPNNVLAYTGIQYGFKGANHNITNHVAGGLQAVYEAQYHIQRGLVDRAIVVAYDMGMEAQGIMHYAALGVLSQSELKPFDRQRDGTILGEAAAVIILESEVAAKARGADIQGEILATSANGEAQGVFGIDKTGEGLASNVAETLSRANVTAEQLGLITAHANGTKASDQADALGLAAVSQHGTPVTGFKWSVGHTISAAGVLETILTLLALREGVAPGIASLNELDPHCASLQVSCDNQSVSNNLALVSCRGFGSFNASLVVKSC